MGLCLFGEKVWDNEKRQELYGDMCMVLLFVFFIVDAKSNGGL